MRYETYTVVMRRNADSLVVRCPQPHAWVDDESGSTPFYWEDGNNSCDCNRFLAFERALGNNPSLDDERCQCGSGRYDVLRFEFPDGTSIPGPDAAV